MLASLTVQDIVLIDRLGIEFDAGLTRADRRDRRRQSPSCSMRCRWRLARAAMRRWCAPARSAARSPRSSSLPPDHPVFALLGGKRHRERRHADPAARRRPPTARRAPSSTTSPAASRCCGRSARCWSRSTASTTTARWSQREEHRRLLDAFGRLEPDAAEVATRYRALEGARSRGRDSSAPRSNPRARDADYLRASVEELDALSPEARRGGAACRAAPVPDAGGEDRRRSERGARARRRQRLADPGAGRARAAAGAEVGGGAGPARRDRRCARRGARPSGGGAARARGGDPQLRVRCGRAGADRGAALRAPRRRPKTSGSGRRSAGGRGGVFRTARRHRSRRRPAEGARRGGGGSARRLSRGGEDAVRPPRAKPHRRWRRRSTPSCRR